MQHSTLDEAFGNEDSSPNIILRGTGAARKEAARLRADAEAAKLAIAEAEREEELAIEKAKMEKELKVKKANLHAKQTAADQAEAKLAAMAKHNPPRLDIWLHERMILTSSITSCRGTRLL